MRSTTGAYCTFGTLIACQDVSDPLMPNLGADSPLAAADCHTLARKRENRFVIGRAQPEAEADHETTVAHDPRHLLDLRVDQDSDAGGGSAGPRGSKSRHPSARLQPATCAAT